MGYHHRLAETTAELAARGLTPEEAASGARWMTTEPWWVRMHRRLRRGQR